MKKYTYVVNTFAISTSEAGDNYLEPVQNQGTEIAENLDDLVDKLELKGLLYRKGYEFISLD